MRYKFECLMQINCRIQGSWIGDESPKQASRIQSRGVVNVQVERYLIPGEVDEEAGLGLQVLAAGEADAVPEELQRRVDEGQQTDGNDVPDKQTDVNSSDEKNREAHNTCLHGRPNGRTEKAKDRGGKRRAHLYSS